MTWTAPIDAYCERLDAGFWAEPLNAATNLAFILAAVACFGLWRGQRENAGYGQQEQDDFSKTSHLVED